MKIICFPHYTCGGLLCDIMNNTWSSIGSHGGILSVHHSIGKIGDSNSIMTDFDPKILFEHLVDVDPNVWIGTHCWLGNVSLNDNVEVINVTTVTHKSKLYRWLRAWHHYYLGSSPWQNLQGIKQIDKQRETAKNYLAGFMPVNRKKFINIEFADVVECKPALFKLVNYSISRHLKRWQKINNFLFEDRLWNSPATQRFYEAEYEVAMNQQYVYQ